MTFFLAIYFGTMGLALIAANLGLTVAYLVAYAMLEPCKRIASFFLYPVAYYFRARLRNTKRVIWPTYLYEPGRGVVAFAFWLFLDDSLMFSQGKEYDDKEKRYSGWIWRSESPFLKAWWWASVRNSFPNGNNSIAYNLGYYIETIKHYGSQKNFYEVRRYDNGVRPYCEFYVFGRWNQVGFLRGNRENNGASRFEIDILKKR